jgi:coniferyl-aldehyde dehydrogenase
MTDHVERPDDVLAGAGGADVHGEALAPPDAMRLMLEQQRAAFARGAPGYRQRMDALAALRDGVRARQEELVRAVDEDFGGRAREETLMLELFPFFDQIRHARRHLRKWMKRKDVRSTWYLRPSRAFYQYQPLGVVGVIGAWNYQLLLTLGPLIDAIAAGNHVMVKPSEITPRSADVIARVVAETFPAEYVSCVTGGPDIASAFSALPFDHLFFTGSTRVGKLVMKAAAENLTPVTLELGGKSPAIIHDSYPVERAAERIMAGKLYNAGQTCIAADYVLLPAGREAEFEDAAAKAVAALYPRIVENRDYTRIVSDDHYRRLRRLIDDAAARSARIVALDPAGEAFPAAAAMRAGEALPAEAPVPAGRAAPADAAPAGDRVIPPTLVFDASDAMEVMQEEIFGPVLPVVTYRTLDEALDYVNARPRPLALYYFDDDRRRVDRVLARTLSGGVTINDCIFHIVQHNLPFGGVGASGMGHYHGFDGFVTFSKKRPVMVRRRLSITNIVRPPYGGARRALFDRIVRLALR